MICIRCIKFLLALLVHLGIFASAARSDAAANSLSTEGFVAVISMDMMILPGTEAHLRESIQAASRDGARALIVELNTPGGMLQTSQDMIQDIFASPIPVVVFVTPTGSSATSAGVFITQAAHIAAMAPGTSIGAAHPVNQDGKDIEGDMRAKAENATIAMVKAIAEKRGRNVQWAERSVKESSSLTSAEALDQRVIDLVAADIPTVLRQSAAKQVDVAGQKVKLSDFSALPIRRYDLSLRNQLINSISHPNVIAILWLLATTGLSIELYNPGLIIPGVVGGIALVISLAMSQVIPMNHGAIALLALGSLLIGIEMFTGSLVLGIGGLISMVLGALYLIDVERAPGMAVSTSLIAPLALLFGGFLLTCTISVFKSYRTGKDPGKGAMIGKRGKALENFSNSGKVSIDGEIWKARAVSGVIAKNDLIEVTGALDGLVLEVKLAETEKSSS